MHSVHESEGENVNTPTISNPGLRTSFFDNSCRMSNEKSTSKDEDITEPSNNIVNAVPAECLEDPRFIKVLAASLLSEIATEELIHNEIDGEVKGLKENVAKGLEKRKVLKEMTQVFTKKNAVVNTALKSLDRDGKHSSTEVGLVKNRLDDASLREIADRNQFKKLLDDYQVKWQEYQAAYEERPLAKERQKARVTSKQLLAQVMMTEFEKERFNTMLKQRKKIDNMRAEVSTVEISKMILEQWKKQQDIQNLNMVAKQLQDKLDACTLQLSQLQQEEEEKKQADIETALMPPPRLDFSFMCSIYNEQENYFKKQYTTSNQTRDLDSVSINTLMLEEMCTTPTNDEVIEVRRKNAQTLEEEEESLNLPTYVSKIQETASINPISMQNDKTSASESMANQTDIQNKLYNLRIEKKITFALDKDQQKLDTDKNNDGIENLHSDYERSILESHQRTLRWCKESQDKFAPFLLSNQRSNSLNEQTKGYLSLEKEGYKSVEKKVPKASSIHGSETKSLRMSERDKHYMNGSPMSVADGTSKVIQFRKQSGNKVKRMDQMEVQDQRKRPSKETLGKNTPIKVGADLHRREKEQQNLIQSPAITTPVNGHNIYETPQGTMLKLADNIDTQETKVSDDNSEIPIDVSCSKPKIRKIEAVHFPFGQRSKETDVTRAYQPEISYSPKQYVPSVMSSNLSTTFEPALHEMPQGSPSSDHQPISDFPSLSNWKNWSPPNSEKSLASSISKIDQSKNTNETTNPNNQQAQPTQSDFFGNFFSMKPSQNPRHIF